MRGFIVHSHVADEQPCVYCKLIIIHSFGWLHFQQFCNGDDDGDVFGVLEDILACIGSYIYMYYMELRKVAHKAFHRLVYFLVCFAHRLHNQIKI